MACFLLEDIGDFQAKGFCFISVVTLDPEQIINLTRDAILGLEEGGFGALIG